MARRPRRGLRLPLRVRLALVYTAVFLTGGVIVVAASYVAARDSMVHRQDTLMLEVGVAVQAAEADTGSATAPEVEAATEAPTGPGKARNSLPVDFVTAMPADVAVVDFEDEVDQFQAGVLDDLLLISAVLLLGVTALSVLASWWIAGRPLRRLRQITETARSLSEHDLHSRLDLTGPNDEFRELGDTIDEMLARLERAFESQRRFVANASHELRTPLSVQRAAVEMPLEQGRVPDDLRPAFHRVLRACDRSERLISGLLLLARSDRGLATPETVDLAETARTVVTRAREEPENDAPVEVTAELESVSVRGEAVLLEHLVRNLVDNAARYNVPEGWVRVTLGEEGNQVVLRVANTGPEVAAPEALFEPFHRGDAARLHRERAGSGLGLSIVRSIATAHAGSVTATARYGGGLLVEARFPRAATELTPELLARAR